jgi:hypothetical protein
MVISANGVASYHGRTSALFEDNPTERRGSNPAPRMPVEWVKKALMAEAAQQREGDRAESTCTDC